MNRRLISVVLFGIVIAGGASLVLYRLMMNLASTNSSTVKSVAAPQIVVAAHDLEVGTVIKDFDLKMAPWPGALPTGSTAKRNDLVGRDIAASIFSGEPITEGRLAPAGSGGGLAAMIPPGKRAVAIHVNEVVGVAGFVVAGTHVDVLASGSRPARTDAPADTVTRTILQDITVLSAGQDYKQNADGKPATAQVVNLLVTPQQAETLSLAGSQTTIQLVLRNPLDKEIVNTPGAGLASILGAASAAVPSAPPVHRAAAHPSPPAVSTTPDVEPVMEIIQGGKRIAATPESAKAETAGIQISKLEATQTETTGAIK